MFAAFGRIPWKAPTRYLSGVVFCPYVVVEIEIIACT
jgi:hypothetical protein